MKKMIEWADCFIDHYSRFFGNYVGHNLFTQNETSPAIQILTYEEGFPGCKVFASLGLSNYHAEVSSRGEIIVPVDNAWADAPLLLADSLFYMVQHRMKLGWGLAISGLSRIRPDFVHKYDKDALYVTRIMGLPKGAAQVSCDNEKALLYLGFYISSSEFRFFNEHGAVRFEELLQSKEIDPFHLQRPSVC